MLRLLDPDELAALLPAATGQALLAAAYDFDDVALGAVTTVHARTVTLAPVLRPELPLSVLARPLIGGGEWQATGTWRPAGTPGVHAVLDITVTAVTRGVRTEVTTVESEPLPGLRAEIDVAADLPAAVDAIAAHLTSVPRDAVAEVLRRRGLTDLDSVRAAFAPGHEAARLVLTLVSDATGADVERPYRLTVLAHAVDDLGAGLLDAVGVLAASRPGLDEVADPPIQPAGVKVRQGWPALVFFPASALDDTDLPGVAGQNPPDDPARRAGRLSELTTRLRRAGIVPVAI